MLALPFSFMFFLTGLRQVHNGFHYTLGVSKNLTALTLFFNSLLMLAAMDAIKYNHLKHHKHCMQEEDVEGKCAKMSAWKSLLYGPQFIYEQHISALHSKKKKVVVPVAVEMIGIVITVTIILISKVDFLVYHVIAMAIGELFTAFFAIWTVHHDCDEDEVARTLSNRWKNKFTYNMFYHLEHHLFPGVPTIKLPVLSKRIKEELPDVRPKEVF
jgi:fatty acid desaturase